MFIFCYRRRCSDWMPAPGDVGLLSEFPMKKIISTLCALSLCGCVTSIQGGGQPVALEDLIRQIKSDIGEYNDYAKAHAGEAPLNNACGGKVNLKITAATVTVTTSAKLTEGATAGAEVSPLPFLKIGVAGGAGREFGNSQTLSFTVVPVSSDGNGEAAALAASQESRPRSQLYGVLTNLRESLLKASDKTPCLRFPDEGQDNSIEFGFSATRSQSMGGTINLYIFALGTNRSSERSAAHTIKIAFEGDGSTVFAQ